MCDVGRGRVLAVQDSKQWLMVGLYFEIGAIEGEMEMLCSPNISQNRSFGVGVSTLKVAQGMACIADNLGIVLLWGRLDWHLVSLALGWWRSLAQILLLTGLYL